MAVTITQHASHCAACFGSKPGTPHVDFSAAYDGPTLVHPDGSPQAVEDLVLCEQCVVAAAFALQSAIDPGGVDESQLQAALDDAAAWRSYAEGLEEAQAERPEPVRRGPGRPKVRAPRPEPQLEAVA